MFLWFPVLDLARAPRRTARKKGSGYENGNLHNTILVPRALLTRGATRGSDQIPFSYPEPFLRAVNGRRRGALAKSISNWHLIGYNEGYCSNNVYIFYHVFMVSGFGFGQSPFSYPEPFLRAVRRGALAKSKTGNHKNMVKDIYVIRTITFVVANQMPV